MGAPAGPPPTRPFAFGCREQATSGSRRHRLSGRGGHTAPSVKPWRVRKSYCRSCSRWAASTRSAASLVRDSIPAQLGPEMASTSRRTPRTASTAMSTCRASWSDSARMNASHLATSSGVASEGGAHRGKVTRAFSRTVAALTSHLLAPPQRARHLTFHSVRAKCRPPSVRALPSRKDVHRSPCVSPVTS